MVYDVFLYVLCLCLCVFVVLSVCVLVVNCCVCMFVRVCFATSVLMRVLVRLVYNLSCDGV